MRSYLIKAGHESPALAFVSPVLMAALLSWFGGSLPKGPTGAHAAPSAEAPAPSGEATATLVSTEAAALQWLAEWRPHEHVLSPMKHAEAPHLDATTLAEMSAAAPPAPGSPAIELTSIIASPAGALATVNGKVVRAGQSVSPGWKVRDIDVSRRQIVVEGPNGIVLTCSPLP